METVLITGGTGLIGSTLSKTLTGKGYRVIILSRSIPEPSLSAAEANLSYARWDIKNQQIDIEAVQAADYIIHLAGAGVMEK